MALCIPSVQIDGSLCGYFNKPFSQRLDVQESFQLWNARQAKRHGVLIDFGEFQATYSNGGSLSLLLLLRQTPRYLYDVNRCLSIAAIISVVRL